MKTRHYLYVLLLAGAAASAQSADQLEETEGPGLILGLSLGVLAWPGLDDIETIDGSSFDGVGMDLGFAGHGRVGRWKRADIFLGAEFGFFGNDSNIPGRFHNVSASGFYFLPSAKLRFNKNPRWPVFIEAGAGWYNAEIVEFDCSGGGLACQEVDTYFSSDVIGGYVGGRIGHGLFASFRVHFVDFGEVEGLDGVSGDMAGPLYMLAGGFAF